VSICPTREHICLTYHLSHGLLFFVGVCEALGYGARLYSHNHPYGGMPFLIGIYLIQVVSTPSVSLESF
jgi:hypothetical protein